MKNLALGLDALRRVGTRVVTVLPEPPVASRTLAGAVGTLRFHTPARATVSVSGDEATAVVDQLGGWLRGALAQAE